MEITVRHIYPDVPLVVERLSAARLLWALALQAPGSDL
jgi:hypothetical protein